MTYPGLSSTFASTLVSHHSVRHRFEVLDLGMRPTGQSVTPFVLDGQVNIDADAEVTRSMGLTILDVDRALGFDGNSPADGALFADRMVRAWYGVRAPLGQWEEVPVFTGPVTKFGRDGATVSIECQGKESLARGASVWRTMSFEKGELKRDVIKKVMRQLGERHFSFESIPGKLPGDRNLTAEMDPWEFVQKLARSMGARLFYDGAGRLVLRRNLARSVWTFRDGTGGSILAPPKVAVEPNAKNAVRVVGKKPKGQKSKVRASVLAPANHPLALKRPTGGDDFERIIRAEFVEDSSIGSDREAKRVANRLLKKLLVQGVGVEASVIVAPQLEEGDVVTVKTRDFTMQTRYSKASISFTTVAGTLGYHRRIGRPSRGKIRGRR